MSTDDETGNVVIVADPGVEDPGVAAVPDAGPADVHVITLLGGDGWRLDHPAVCAQPAVCPVTEAAGRIGRAMCATLGRWTVDVHGASLVLLDRIGD